MSDTGEFTGFPEECITFLSNLSDNNTTNWFKQHRNEYDDYVLDPSRAFIGAMGKRLQSITPDIIADPRVNRSLFKINRDIRFSKNKTPYKTHLAIWFWEGTRPRMECSGYYFHLEPGRLMLGVGIYQFPKNILDMYRQAVVDKKKGPALVRALKKVAGSGEYSLGGSHYIRVPRGFDPDHKNVSLLLHNGLYVGMDTTLPDELYSGDIIDYCGERYAELAPLHEWLVDLTE
ncbi:DUF2461 domain-containing protein [Candidatus Latescibacterota bacterium]